MGHIDFYHRRIPFACFADYYSNRDLDLYSSLYPDSLVSDCNRKLYHDLFRNSTIICALIKIYTYRKYALPLCYSLKRCYNSGYNFFGAVFDVRYCLERCLFPDRIRSYIVDPEVDRLPLKQKMIIFTFSYT